MKIWQITYKAAPFSFRVVDDIIAYAEVLKITPSWSETSWLEPFDEQITQKVLPKVKGADPATEKSLLELASFVIQMVFNSHTKDSGDVSRKGKERVVLVFYLAFCKAKFNSLLLANAEQCRFLVRPLGAFGSLTQNSCFQKPISRF